MPTEFHHHDDPLTTRGFFHAIDYFFERLEESQSLHSIERKLDRIMTEVENLRTTVEEQGRQIDTMQESLDKEQEQIKAAIDNLGTINTALQATNDQLQALINEGATASQLQEISAQVVANNAKLASMKADLEGTIPDAEG